MWYLDTGGTDPTPTPIPIAPIIIEVPQLEWWQGFVAILISVVGILGVLGLSPAPWLLGLAAGRLQFTAPAKALYDARVQDIKDAATLVLTETTAHHDQLEAIAAERYSDLKESRNYYRDASRIDRERADKATATVAEVLDVVKATNHLMTALNEVSQSRKGEARDQ
jgi:hypothetical protein